MIDYLSPAVSQDSINSLSTLALAHIGDSVFEIMARTYVLMSGSQTSKNMHANTVHIVCAPSQAKAAAAVLPVLTEAERSVFVRGRNAKPKHIPRPDERMEYSLATGLEALFGWLYLNQQNERLNEIFSRSIDAIKNESCSPRKLSN